jgi:acyl-CoA thioesterase-1
MTYPSLSDALHVLRNVTLIATIAASAALAGGRSGPAAAEPLTIVAFGDSLTAGYGLSPSAAFPVQLEKALRERGHDVTVSNAGVSGDTTAAGLSRLDWSIGEEADAVILELGANDALRGVDAAIARDNLEAIMARLKERDLPVLIAGMRAPPNLGEAYAADFEGIFPDLAARYDAVLYPFFLDGVAADPALNLDDGIHPTAEGVALIVENILPAVEELIARADPS